MNTWIVIALVITAVLIIRLVILPRILYRRQSEKRHDLERKKLAYITTALVLELHLYLQPGQRKTFYRYCLKCFRHLDTEETFRLYMFFRDICQTVYIIRYYEAETAKGRTAEELRDELIAEDRNES